MRAVDYDVMHTCSLARGAMATWFVVSTGVTELKLIL